VESWLPAAIDRYGWDEANGTIDIEDQRVIRSNELARAKSFGINWKRRLKSGKRGNISNIPMMKRRRG
jgi:uncharacterized protein YdhG (YjbR/CyaY superfamily)